MFSFSDGWRGAVRQGCTMQRCGLASRLPFSLFQFSQGAVTILRKPVGAWAGYQPLIPKAEQSGLLMRIATEAFRRACGWDTECVSRTGSGDSVFAGRPQNRSPLASM